MSFSIRTYLLLGAGLLGLQALLLFLFGQPPICECGFIKLWEADVGSSGNSQHLADWYTPSHVIHGIVFYWLITLIAPRLPLGVRLLIALGIEVSWEVIENTPTVIEHYRKQALAQGYVGDSIVNSLSDTLAMVLGFFAAWRCRWWWGVLLAVLLEALALYAIRDSLALNILGFFYQFDFITNWQSGV